MGARQVLALGSAALGALAALNSALAPPPPPAPPTYGPQERYRWSGGDIHYTVNGAGPAVVLVHSIGLATSSFEMRYIVEPLARSFRVYAPDLLGFGLSDRPPIAYTPDLYLALLEGFLRDVAGPSAIVAGGLSGAYCLALAARTPELLRALVLSNPPPVSRGAPGPVRQASEALLDTPILGQSVLNMLTARVGIRAQLREQAYSNPDLVTESMVDAQYAMAHQPRARHALRAYLSGRLDLDAREAVASLRHPLLLVFGADVQPGALAAAYVRLNPRAQVVILERCRRFPHEEQAERFVDAALPWLGS